MNLLKDIPDLVKAEVISEETAVRIRDYYRTRAATSTNRLFVVFGILGAILVGLGIVLILAHNWDELSRVTKTFFAFLPLLIGQGLCAYVLMKRQREVAWRESSTAFLFFAVGASISLISQIYHIPGNLSAFLLTWMLLCLPLIYVMNSSTASLLYLIGITWYAGETSYWSYPQSDSYMYWLLLLAALPYYIKCCTKLSHSNFTIFHNWVIPASLAITLGTLAKESGELMMVAYMSLFGLFYLIGEWDFFRRDKLMGNGFKIIGSLGTMGLLLILSFDWFWKELKAWDFQWTEVILSPEMISTGILSLLAGFLLYRKMQRNPLAKIPPMAFMFLLFIIAFIIGMFSPFAQLVVNLYVFGFGLITMKEGARLNHLGVLNYGLLIIAALVACRFFDTGLSFVIRGILFVLVGVGFFAVNYWMLKKRRAYEN
ncbi:hypothetical protein GCM10028791_36470 [Echinicola sediminis]